MDAKISIAKWTSFVVLKNVILWKSWFVLGTTTNLYKIDRSKFHRLYKENCCNISISIIIYIYIYIYIRLRDEFFMIFLNEALRLLRKKSATNMQMFCLVPYILNLKMRWVIVKDWGLTKLQYLFGVPLEKLFLLLWQSELNNWLVWSIRPLLRSGRKDNYPHMLLVSGCLSLVLVERNYSTQTNAVTKNSVFQGYLK